MAPEKGVVFFLFQTTLLKLQVPCGHIAGYGLIFPACFSAFQNNGFSRHDLIDELQIRTMRIRFFKKKNNYLPCPIPFSIKGNISPRRKRETWPVLLLTTTARQSVANVMEAAAAWRVPNPLGNE